MSTLVSSLITISVLTADPQLERLQVKDAKREALVFASTKPAPQSGAPLVFVFHGHGGDMKRAARKFPVHELWPEAVVIYMQGLRGTAGKTCGEYSDQ